MTRDDCFSFPKWLSERESVTKANEFSAPLGANYAYICFDDVSYETFLNSRVFEEQIEIKGFSATHRAKVADQIGVFFSYFGAPAAGLLLETLIASGVKKVLMVGEAGSISTDCKVGDVVIPTWGIREEGTSYHYLPPDVPVKPSERFLKTLRSKLKDMQIIEGGVWTIDASLRETPDKVRLYAAKGVKAVEMECTALMAISSFRKIDFASVLVITDELSSGGWLRDDKGEKVIDTKEKLSSRLDSSVFR